jgi:hypothetical protein
MNVKELRELYSAAPFQPFEMVLTNGSTVYVGHPEFMMFSNHYRTVYTQQTNGTATPSGSTLK